MTDVLTITPADLAAVLERLAEIQAALARPVECEQPPPKLLLPRPETAESLSCSISQLDALRRAGILPAVYIDGNPRWAVADLEQFIESRRGAEPTRKRQPRK